MAVSGTLQVSDTLYKIFKKKRKRRKGKREEKKKEKKGREKKTNFGKSCWTKISLELWTRRLQPRKW